MKRPISWLTAVLVIGCAILGYFLFRQKTELSKVNERSVAAEQDAQKRIVTLQRELTDAKKAAQIAERQAAQLARSASGAASSQSKAASAGSGDRVIVHIGDILKDHPEYLALYAKQMRRNVDRMYGDSLNTLNLPPNQLSQLRDLLAERQMSAIDAQNAAAAAGLERGSQAWQDAMKQASQDVEQQIAGILGPNADSTLVQLQVRNNILTQVMPAYAPDFADAGNALTPEQSRGLVQAMADANYAGKDTSTRPENYNDVDPATGLSPHDDRIIGAASQVLSPAQVQILKTDQADNEKMAAIMRQYSNGGRAVFVP